MIICWIKQLLMILYMISTVDSESYYSINAPGIIKSNRKYSVFVAVHEANDTCALRVGIEGPNFKEFKNINLQPFESQLIEFFPNKLKTGDYVLKAESLSGLDLKNSSRIYAHGDYGPKMYIQTDKAIYKPQDVVRFRVVILDEHTRPFKADEPIRIEILDDEDNRVKQFKDISLTNGVYSNQFKLSKYPVLGYWKIKVILDGKYNYSSHETIAVRNYVLPKFSVHIKTPSDIVLEDGYLKVVIFGKYTFDKHVEGNATIELWKDRYEKLLQTKYVDTENLGFVEFNIKNDEDIRKAYYLKVRASLSEKHTGRNESYVQDINVRKQRYNVEIPYDDIEFENNRPYRLKVYVKHWTGAAVLDYKTPVIMEHGNKTYEAFLNENGVATFEFEHERDADHKFQFKDSKAQLPNIYTSDNLMLNNKEYYCRLKLLDENLELGKPIQIEVSSIAYIPYLMYIVMGHASIILTHHIKLPPNQKSYTITLTPSIEMIPHSFFYVYYIDNGNLRYEEMTLKFPYEFENQISLSAPKQAKPGQEVTIEINAQPKSYVSLLAVDLGVYLLDKSYDLKKSKILRDLDEERSYSPVSATVYPGLLSGLLTLTNAHYKFEILNNLLDVKAFSPSLHEFRKKFPETWIFDNFFVNETITKLTLPIPDTITTWRITAFSNNNETGFGIVNGPTDITTIQPFFISLNLPYSVKRGEIVTIAITIFNYLNEKVNTEVIFYNEEQEFYFMESKIQEFQKSSQQDQIRKNITIEADKAKTLNYLIYPIKSGEIDIRISATNDLYSDAILQKLKVEPEGVTKEKSQSLYLSIPKGEKILKSFTIEKPNNTVPDSDYITFTVGGHYLVPTVENFQDLIHMPTGCGEQNMVNFAPSVLILEYLKANGKLTKEKDLVDSLRSAIEDSYQQQLSFRHANGGFSVFGMATDEEPSTWLTAYVVRYFIKASQFIGIEEKVIETGLKYLADQQKSNGEFSFTGYLLNPKHKSKYGLTAFVLLAFLESEKYASKYQLNIHNAIEFLNSNLNDINDLYEISLIGTTIKRAKHQNANILIKQLQNHVIEMNGCKFWSGMDENLANDIEITSYAAMCLLETPGDHTSILKWLIEQRNSKGGFKSSYDTVVGMEALVKFSEKYKNFQNINLQISYTAKDQEGYEVASNEVQVDTSNVFDLQKFELPNYTREVIFEMEGNGASLVQLTHQYNLINVEEFRHFIIEPKAKLKNPQELNLEICFTYQSDSNKSSDVTNMIIMEANLPSGFISEAENSLSLKEHDLVQRIESKNSQTTIILYLDKLEVNNRSCLEILADKKNEILMPKPAAIIMYDYYNLTRSNTEFYSL